MFRAQRFSIILIFLALFLLAAQVHGAGEQTHQQQGRPEFVPGPATGRGFIKTKMQSAPGGAILTVEVVQDRLESRVRLLLALDGGAHSPGTPNWELTPGVSNPRGYKMRFEFLLNYDALRKSATRQGIQGATQRIAPGQSMVVIAEFPSGHRWGGTDRNGIITLTKPQTTRTPQATEVVEEATPPRLPGLGEGPPATSLDVGQLIDEALAEQFAPLRGRGGLEVGGQIRSRVEAEGKFQLDETEFLRIRQRLFEIASNPTLARRVLGSEWTLKVVDRYMKKVRGRLVKDADGFPIPDPMVDTYYDTENLDAAKNDIAIRYRWTEGNNTGNWNFKPGIGRVSKDGIVYRVEYAVDAIGDKPESIEVFANSNHPLNFFQLLREIVPGVTPGKFFYPSIRLTDDRYKFALQHKNGLVIEVSLDRVLAERLIKRKNSVVFFQLEMDVEHVATEVQNTAPEPASSEPGQLVSPYASLHIPEDVGVNSPTLETQAATFSLATTVIKRLRDDVIGKNWRPGAQKYAFAAAALGAMRPSNASRSVRALGFTQGKCADLLGGNQ